MVNQFFRLWMHCKQLVALPHHVFNFDIIFFGRDVFEKGILLPAGDGKVNLAVLRAGRLKKTLTVLIVAEAKCDPNTWVTRHASLDLSCGNDR
jgi:hypothetical protein